MSLAVIVPNYNKAKYIGKCITSIYEQSYQPTEVIVVDDCSSDNSIDVVRELQRQYLSLKLVPLMSNGGVSNARNRGVKETMSTYITFLDSDDFYFNRDKLKNEMNLIQRYGENTVAYSYTVKVDENGIVIRYRMGTFRYPSGKCLVKLIANYRACSGMPRDYCLSKSLFLKCGGYTPQARLYEDMELTIKLSEQGAELYNTQQYGTAYRSVSGGLSEQNQEVLNKKQKELFRSHYYKLHYWNRILVLYYTCLNMLFKSVDFIFRRVGVEPDQR